MKTIRLILFALSSAALLTGCEIFKDWDEDDSLSLERTLEYQPDGSTGVDAGVFSCVECGYSTRNFGNIQEFSAIATTNGGSSNARALIRFDLSNIPEGAVITSATLSLYYANSPSNGDHRYQWGSNSCKLQRVTSPWDEQTVTWATQPSVSSTNQVILPASTTETQDYPDINVTKLIADIVADQSKNYGMMLRLQTEEIYRQLIFASSDHPDATKRPKLVVKYKKKLTH
jgi:hypothetical protein